MWAVIASIIPTAGVTYLFWLAVRAMFQADRRERLAVARSESVELRRATVVPAPLEPGVNVTDE